MSWLRYAGVTQVKFDLTEAVVLGAHVGQVGLQHGAASFFYNTPFIKLLNYHGRT